jgi:hypothetical protein
MLAGWEASAPDTLARVGEASWTPVRAPWVSDCRRDEAELPAKRRRVAQRRAGCGKHLRQDQPLERPGGARSLIFMDERLVSRGEQRCMETTKRDEPFPRRPGAGHGAC